MKKISALTSDSKQSMSIELDNGDVVDISFSYTESQSGWNYSVTYGDFSSKNRRLVNSPNMLRSFRNIIPFGLACMVADGQEPVYIDDFTTGRVTIYILESADIALIEGTTIPGYR